jgi:hypothetical protein
MEVKRTAVLPNSALRTSAIGSLAGHETLRCTDARMLLTCTRSAGFTR